MTPVDFQAGRDVPPEPVLSSAHRADIDRVMDSAVERLSQLVVDIHDVAATLARIASLAASAIPGADGVGVSVLQREHGAGSERMTWVAGDDMVRAMDHLQYEICHEGPCLSAVHTTRAQISGSLGSDRRWPRFGGRAARQHVHAALSQPLTAQDKVVGALNVYARDRDALTAHAQDVAQRFAAPVAVTVANLVALNEAHQRAGHLEIAMRTRPVVDQAIGIIRSRAGGGSDEAFQRLRQISQRQNTKLSVVAQRIVDEAVRRANARHVQG